MSLYRRNPRRDANERDIIAALEAIGAKVEQRLRTDLIVKFRGQIHLLEVSNPDNKYRQREQEQLDFLTAWQIPIVNTAEEAMQAIGASRVP